jgi:serine/threonine protein kinase
MKVHVNGSSEHRNREILATRYEIQGVLGQGGFGRTYLTFDLHRFDEPCVIKEFLPQNLGEYEAQKSRELFEREANILYQIDHPQVPKFFACFEENKRLFLVQEYIKGETYSSLLHKRQQRGNTFSELEIVQLLKDLLPVLTYVHNCNIIHRDISPDNIMIQHDCHLPILIDFGIGKYNLAQGQGQDRNLATPIKNSSQKTIVGKIGYAPHEQILLGDSSPSSDLYALAVTAVVLLTGISPQPLTNQPSLKQNWQSYTCVSDGLVQILNRMLQDIPGYRYQSAGEVLADLERLIVSPPTQLSQPEQNSQPTMLTVPTPVPHIQTPIPHIQTPVPHIQTPVPHIQTPVPHIQTTAPQAQISSFNSLTARFVAQCEQELKNYAGPIAKFLVQKTLAKNPDISPEALVNLLADQIPEPSQAREFRNRILR